MRKTLIFIMLIAVPVLLVAAIQPPKILQIHASLPAPGALSQTDPPTRIFRAPAAILETGLELPDLITNMAFDPDGNLWMTSTEGGPYLYSVRMNELTNMIFPDTVYGVFTGHEGVWILSSEKASLFRGSELLRNIYFPDQIVPISGIEDGELTYFGTNEGLFVANKLDQLARPIDSSQYIQSVAVHRNGLLLATSNGLNLWKTGSRKSFIPASYLPRKGTFSSLVCMEDGIFAGTEQDGILQIESGNWKKIHFARQNLNMNSFNAAVVFDNKPWFGTLDGSVVFRTGLQWRWIRLNDFPVTALATDGASLFAWSGGKLVQILYEE